MKRVMIMLIAGTALSGAAAVYATTSVQTFEKTPPASARPPAAR